MRVLVVDDEALVRSGIGMILSAQPDLEIVGEAADGRAAVEAARRLRPDIVLMDIRMPEVDGLEATRRLAARPGMTPRILILTTFDLDEYVYEAMRAGASGFLLKTAPPEQLVNAVRVVAAGDALLAPSITRRLIEQFVGVTRPRPLPTTFEELTSRERDVLRLVARGRSNAEIAAELVVTAGTVKTHVNRILAKLGLRDRVQAVVLAYETGFATPADRQPADPKDEIGV